MTQKILRIGTRESQLAVWQATRVQELLAAQGIASELVYIRSEGDIDLKTPLYEIGVQGIFTKTLDAAVLSGRVDLAVHSMKDVPTALPGGMVQAAVLPRASYKDLLVPSGDTVFLESYDSEAVIATSSIRRRAQWLQRYPHHQMENLRGNVNSRMQKLAVSNWNGAIFAAAGLERIGLRPDHAIELHWMLPAPAQGAILVVCRQDDDEALEACRPLHDAATALCVGLERDFLRSLMGGCATPISALARIEPDSGMLSFEGQLLSLDGSQMVSVSMQSPRDEAAGLGNLAGQDVLARGGADILQAIRHGQN
jgi:hydroxymethylbilane synthase